MPGFETAALAYDIGFMAGTSAENSPRSRQITLKIRENNAQKSMR